VGKYSTSGTTVSASLISSGLNKPAGIATDGTNLYVVNFGANSVGAFTLGGAPVNTTLIMGLSDPIGIAWLPTVVNPPTLNVGVTNGNATLTWAQSPETFRLLQSTVLASNAWSAVTNTAAIVNGLNQV